MADYSLPQEENVKLDDKTEQTLHEIKSSLRGVINTLHDLSKKVEDLDKET